MKRETAWNKYDDKQRRQIFSFAGEYRNFITHAKTEREANDFAVEELRAAGYQDLDVLIAAGKELKPGDRVYRSNMGKGLAVFQIGTRPIEDGMNILGAHIDSPRLDLKQNPLYEDTNLAMLDTHYYGGIKKYQWTTRPMALHGVVAKKDGSVIPLNIGEAPDDPVFGVSDLLPHLAGKQMQKKASDVVTGEALNVLAGSIPLNTDLTEEEKKNLTDEQKEDLESPVKGWVLHYLKDHYGISEMDLESAEIEVVPAGPARDYGFDRSMIMGYGHDDKVCAFPSYKAMLDLPEEVERTCCCLLVDKEEIGSMGATGMQSRFFENTVAEVLDLAGQYRSDLSVRRALANSMMLSSDVSAAFDPNYPSVMDKNNCCYLGGGMVINKYTGARGKSSSNDANAEYMALIRRIFDDADVSFQTAELGKVDEGGGGTIAMFMANYGMNVIDSGVAVLNMHAPNEIISKVDVYEAYLGYTAFLKNVK